MNNDEKKKLSFKEIVTNKQYRAIANLIFYGCIILALIILVRTTPSSNSNGYSKDRNGNNIIETSVDGFQDIKNKNFNFKYTLADGDTEKIYEGKQYNDVISFNSSGKEYFLEDGIFLEKENDNYVLSKFDIEYFNYFDVDLLEKILSKCKISDNEYTISLNEFGKVIGSSDLTDEDVYISIIVEKKNKIITKLEFDLSEMIKTKEDLYLTLEYSNFNLIDEFSIKNK